MNLALTVLDIASPVFALAAVGYVWVRLGIEYPTEFVNRLVMNLAMPCLIFTALVEADVTPEVLGALSLAALAAYAGSALAFAAVLGVAGLDRRSYLAPLIFNNTGNLGLPLALFAFGAAGLGYAVVIFAVTNVLFFTVGVLLVSGAAQPLRVLREPLVAASLMGGLFLWQGWAPPEIAMRSLSLIGQIAIPVMLITLGVAVARLEAGWVGRALWLSVAKLGISAGAGLLAGRAFGLAPVPMAVLVLQMATPVAVVSYLLAERFDADSQAVAGLVLVSTLLSVATLPLVLGFLI